MAPLLCTTAMAVAAAADEAGPEGGAGEGCNLGLSLVVTRPEADRQRLLSANRASRPSTAHRLSRPSTARISHGVAAGDACAEETLIKPIVVPTVRMPLDIAWMVEVAESREQAERWFNEAHMTKEDAIVSVWCCGAAARAIQIMWAAWRARQDLPWRAPHGVTHAWTLATRSWCREAMQRRRTTDTRRWAVVAAQVSVDEEVYSEDLGLLVGRALHVIRFPMDGSRVTAKVSSIGRGNAQHGPVHELEYLHGASGAETVVLKEGAKALTSILLGPRGRPTSGMLGGRADVFGRLNASYEVEEDYHSAVAAVGEVQQQDWHLIITSIHGGLLSEAFERKGVQLFPGCRIVRVNRARLAIDMFRELTTTHLHGDVIDIEVAAAPPELLRSAERLHGWRWPTDEAVAVAGPVARPPSQSTSKGAFPHVVSAPSWWQEEGWRQLSCVLQPPAPMWYSEPAPAAAQPLPPPPLLAVGMPYGEQQPEEVRAWSAAAAAAAATWPVVGRQRPQRQTSGQCTQERAAALGAMLCDTLATREAPVLATPWRVRGGRGGGSGSVGGGTCGGGSADGGSHAVGRAGRRPASAGCFYRAAPGGTPPNRGVAR